MGAHGADQIGLRVGDDVTPRALRRRRDRRHRRQRRQGRGDRALPRRRREAPAARVGAADARLTSGAWQSPPPVTSSSLAAGVPRLTITASTPLTVWMLTGYCARPTTRDGAAAALPVIELPLRACSPTVGPPCRRRCRRCRARARSRSRRRRSWKYGAVVERVADVGGEADVELAALRARRRRGSSRASRPR